MYTFIRLMKEKQMEQNANKVQKEGNKSIKLLLLYDSMIKMLNYEQSNDIHWHI
jgi:tagatose-1,6-bisphosphate aldolase